MDDLQPEELALHQVLSAVKPAALPIGFRDAVMASVRAEDPSSAWEWIVAAALALPSVAYLLWELTAHGSEFLASFGAIVAAAQGLDEATGADFFVDGLAIVAFALVGIASVLAAHALIRTTAQRSLIR
ncbi:MAG TPA: hypothetical protein VF998_04290 [Candidatus Limnocylindria bacterium]